MQNYGLLLRNVYFALAANCSDQLSNFFSLYYFCWNIMVIERKENIAYYLTDCLIGDFASYYKHCDT